MEVLKRTLKTGVTMFSGLNFQQGNPCKREKTSDRKCGFPETQQARSMKRAGAVRPQPQCSRGYAVDLGFLIQLVKGLKGSLKIRLHSQYLERNYRSGPRRKDHLYQTH
jgi:hypothetical protein